jgi:hypothetical protein
MTLEVLTQAIADLGTAAQALRQETKDRDKKRKRKEKMTDKDTDSSSSRSPTTSSSGSERYARWDPPCRKIKITSGQWSKLETLRLRKRCELETFASRHPGGVPAHMLYLSRVLTLLNDKKHVDAADLACQRIRAVLAAEK